MQQSPAAPSLTPTPGDLSQQLETLLLGYASRVRQVALRFGLHDRDAEDLVQDVRIRLWKALGDRGTTEPVNASYVHRAAVSAAVDFIRRRRARREADVDISVPSGEATLGAAPPPDGHVEEKELQDLVLKEITQLPPDRALAVRLHLSGYDRREIAEFLDWGEARTRHLIYRGLEMLRSRLRARGIGPERVP